MIQGIFDSHAHYDDEAFDSDRDRLLSQMPGQGINRVMCVGADLISSAAAVELAQRYPFVSAAVGVHPHGAEELPADYLEQLKRLAARPKVRAVGEIGLDYHYDGAFKERQQVVFRQQLDLARELDLPVIIHDREAHQDTLNQLRSAGVRGVVHCFSGSAEMAKELLRLGFYIGFTGVVTFKNARKVLEAAAVVPDDRILVETDCPYLAPEPYRGRRCDSTMLPMTIERLAALRGVTPQRLADQTRGNAETLFRMGS